MNYRQGKTDDLKKLKELAINSWQQFRNELTDENWHTLYKNISNNQTFTDLLASSYCFVCETEHREIIGMAFIVPSGKQHDIFEKEWAVIRFVTVNPAFGGQGIGKQLTEMCIEWAKQNNEKTIALHTSEIMNSARHIYENYGFTILREIEQRLGKRYLLYTLDIEN
jgi:ribosomal protein S18 acetylase RimI-like enzyme